MTAVVEPEPGTLGRQLVSAAASLVFELELADGEDYAARSVTPTQLAETLSPATEIRTLAAELIGVAALSDGVLAVDRVREALAYASALGVSPSWTTDLSDVAGGRVDRAMHDMVVRNAATFPGLAGADGDPVLLPYTGRSDDDRRLYDRFASLEDYPEGSYGRAFWVHFRRHGFRFPGQEGAFNGAFAVPHDGLHVLSGYDTSMQGELLVSTFTGRMHAVDALSAHILPVIFEWHIGQEVNGIGAQHAALDPWKFLYAWQRGRATTSDVLDPGWRFFEVADQPLDRVRTQYGIPNLPERFQATGPEVNLTSEADSSVR